MMLCPKCGQETEDQAQLCPHCGAPLQSEPAETEVCAPEETVATDCPQNIPADTADTTPAPASESQENTGLTEDEVEETQENADSAVEDGEDADSTEEDGEDAPEDADSTVEDGEDAPENADSTAEDGEDAQENADSAEESGEDAQEDAESTEESGEDAPEDAESTAEDAGEPMKKSHMGILLGVVIALLVVIVVSLGVALKYVSDGNSLPTVSDVKEAIHEKNFDADAVAVYIRDEDGMDVAQIDNRMFSFYYWGEYYYFVNSYGFQFDSSKPLAEQTYEEETNSETGESTITTWQDYFMDAASYSMNQIAAMKQAGEAEGFQLPEEYQTEYDSVVETMASNAASAGFVDEDGNGDALAYIQDSYGSSATIETFQQYLYDSYYASAYSDHIYYGLSYTTEEIDAYFDENTDYFSSYGVEKTDIPNVNVRHILIEPEADEDGNISDEAWAAALATAEDLLAQWKSGDATEESFGQLAEEHSTDSGSSSNGGLYEDVYPGQMVTAFNDWCFDSARQVGDTDIVQTDFGYHIMYFVSQTDSYYYRTVAESEMRYYDGNALLEEMVDSCTVTYTDDVDVVYPDAVKTIMEKDPSELS